MIKLRAAILEKEKEMKTSALQRREEGRKWKARLEEEEDSRHKADQELRAVIKRMEEELRSAATQLKMEGVM